MKRIFSLLLVAVMLVATLGLLSGCSNEGSDFKVGFIFLHDENSTYDMNFIAAARIAADELRLATDQVVFKKNVPEDSSCYEAAADLVDQGCDIIFANSFGHEPYMIQAAKEFPDVQFCHATGTSANIEKLPNFHNAFANIYEGRYLAGVAAGIKLNEKIANGEITAEEAKIGYVGAFEYAEVISGYTSFYLGAKAQCPTVTMEVEFTGEWYDETKEQEAAKKLITNGCVLISQHADSMGAPRACEEAGVPNVSYNGSTLAACPNTFITASRIDWTPYFVYMVNCVQNGEEIAVDWSKGMYEGSVKMEDLNENIFASFDDARREFNIAKVNLNNTASNSLVEGDEPLYVFDTDNFTVNGEKVESYLVDLDGDGTAETEAIIDGYFHESEFRSAPYFDLKIDGITLLNSAV